MIATEPATETALPRPATAQRNTRGEKARERYIEIAAALKAAAGITQHTAHKKMTGYAYWGLSYRSQRESPWSRTASRMQDLRARLGGSANLMEGFPPRPRYMHHRTYQRLRARYSSLSQQNTAELAGFVYRLKRQIGAPT